VCDGRVATITAAMRAEALDAYLYPFARPDVPDIFSEAASLREECRAFCRTRGSDRVVEPNQTSLESRWRSLASRGFESLPLRLRPESLYSRAFSGLPGLDDHSLLLSVLSTLTAGLVC